MCFFYKGISIVSLQIFFDEVPGIINILVNFFFSLLVKSWQRAERKKISHKSITETTQQFINRRHAQHCLRKLLLEFFFTGVLFLSCKEIIILETPTCFLMRKVLKKYNECM